MLRALSIVREAIAKKEARLEAGLVSLRHSGFFIRTERSAAR